MTPPDQSAAFAADATPKPRPSTQPQTGAKVLRALALLPALAFAVMALSPPLNHDVAAILNFAERWLAGERLYRDLLDVNPPLIFVLTAIPAAIARWTPLDGVQAQLLCVLGCCVLAWWMTVSLRERAQANTPSERAQEGPVESAVLDVLVPLVAVLAAYDVGQREHLMALFAMPYAFLAARRMQGLATAPRLALCVTLAAALGFALKPHFLAVPFLVEALVLWRRGPRAALRDKLPWLMALIWLLYLATLPLLFSDYLEHVLPLVMQFYTNSHGFGLIDVLLGPLVGPALLALLPALALLAWRDAGDTARALGCVGAGAFLSAWV